MEFHNNKLESILLETPDSAGLVSKYYPALSPRHSHLVDRARASWTSIAPELSDEMWTKVFAM